MTKFVRYTANFICFFLINVHLNASQIRNDYNNQLLGTLYADYNNDFLSWKKLPQFEDYADPSMAENQDRITGNVWITRGTSQPLYNAALESGYQDESISPEGTVWATGQTAFHVSADHYQAFKQATGGNHQNLPGRVMSMHIVGTGLFYDVEYWIRHKAF